MNKRHKFTPGLYLLLIVALLTVALGIAPAPVTAAPAVDTLDDLPAEAWYAISDAIGADQPAYHVERTRAGYALANPAQGLRAAFTRAGVTLQTADLAWEMNLRAWGYGETLAAARAVEPAGAANRVAYEREGLTEWYVNGPLGLQQGFTLHQPPGKSRGAVLTLQIGLPAGLVAQVDESGLNLTLLGADGALRLAYGGLLAWDAARRALPAWFDLSRDELRIRVDDRAAQYPLTIDPWVQTAKLTASDGAADDYFGGSVAVSGDTVVVGAFADDSYKGSAYVFAKPGGGWADMTQTAKLTASDGAADDQFGGSVAVSGDTVVVGAFADDSYKGSAYVFAKPGGGWADMTQTAKLTASDGAAGDWFGYSVAVSGDTVVVGAYRDDSNRGSAYVFEKPGGGWTGNLNENAKLTASDGAADDQFGDSVAVSGDTVVVGAYGDDSEQGSAYVFAKPGTVWATTSAFDAKLTASDGAADDEFGGSVAVSGDTVVVGAFADDSYKGSAYVFAKPGGGWADMTQTAKLTASDGAAWDEFGYSVAVSGDTVVVGADGDDSDRGSAYVFEKPGGGWTGNLNENAKLTASDGAADDQFGDSVAVSGDTVVVGAYGDDFEQGSAYMFAPASVGGHTESVSPLVLLWPWVALAVAAGTAAIAAVALKRRAA